MLRYHLCDASDLKKVLIRAVEVIVPEAFKAAVLEPLKHDSMRRVFSASTLSRERFMTDVFYMLCMRRLNEASLQQNTCARYLMVDASVQGHYDFKLIRCLLVDTSRADTLVDAF